MMLYFSAFTEISITAVHLQRKIVFLSNKLTHYYVYILSYTCVVECCFLFFKWQIAICLRRLIRFQRLAPSYLGIIHDTRKVGMEFFAEQITMSVFGLTAPQLPREFRLFSGNTPSNHAVCDFRNIFYCANIRETARLLMTFWLPSDLCSCWR